MNLYEKTLPEVRVIVRVCVIERQTGLAGGVTENAWADNTIVVREGDVAGKDFNALVERTLTDALAMRGHESTGDET